mmetsp:Transcript_12988/g.52322  ORF Transcript_12988/g.52322 Transcript_12988/m.52322 type:complete len:82 (+) Transcript_12988:68-313(+)
MHSKSRSGAGGRRETRWDILFPRHTTHDDGGLSLSYLLSPRRYPRERPPQSQRLEICVRRDRFARLIVALDDALEQSLPGV